MFRFIKILIVFFAISNCTFSQTVTIGNQIWCTNNLSVTKFRNGEPIPQAKSENEWLSAGVNGTPAWCYYENDASNGNEFGILYNWFAVNDPRGLAPIGYHIPSDSEWMELITYLGTTHAGMQLKSKSSWNDKGTNSSGFSGLPGGSRTAFGSFGYIGFNGNWWCSTEKDKLEAWCFNLNWYYNDVGRNSQFKKDGYSIRCLKD